MSIVIIVRIVTRVILVALDIVGFLGIRCSIGIVVYYYRVHCICCYSRYACYIYIIVRVVILVILDNLGMLVSISILLSVGLIFLCGIRVVMVIVAILAIVSLIGDVVIVEISCSCYTCFY